MILLARRGLLRLWHYRSCRRSHSDVSGVPFGRLCSANAACSSFVYCLLAIVLAAFGIPHYPFYACVSFAVQRCSLRSRPPAPKRGTKRTRLNGSPETKSDEKSAATPVAQPAQAEESSPEDEESDGENMTDDKTALVLATGTQKRSSKTAAQRATRKKGSLMKRGKALALEGYNILILIQKVGKEPVDTEVISEDPNEFPTSAWWSLPSIQKSHNQHVTSHYFGKQTQTGSCASIFVADVMSVRCITVQARSRRPTRSSMCTIGAARPASGLSA
jgi:hypothetical protein